LVIAGLLLALVGRAEAVQEGDLRKHTIDAAFTSGYQVSVADINGDAMPDIVALSTVPSRLAWYRNPDWTRFEIATGTDRNIDVAPHDIDGDGDMDLALAYEFDLQRSDRGGNVCWLECPADPTVTNEWRVYPIDAVPTSHRVRWGDVDGDGKVELLNLPIIGVGAKAPAYTGALEFRSYTIPKDPRAATWNPVVLSRDLELAHGFCVVSREDVAKIDIYTASAQGVLLHTFDTKRKASVSKQYGVGYEGSMPKRGASEVAVGGARSQGGSFLTAIEPWHGNEVVVYTSETPDTMPWPRTVIDTSLTDGHALACVDLDGDGNDEIVAGGRGGERSLNIYQFATESAEWERTAIDKGGMGAAGVFIADINRDGRDDIVAIGTATNNVVWYENVIAR